MTATSPSAAAVASPAQLFDLSGRVAIVTGASSGLGERFSRVLAAAGATVVAAARRTDRLDALAADVEGVEAVRCDVAVEDDCHALVATTLERHGQLDVLVNNAGISNPMPAEQEPPEWWRQMFDVNVHGLFTLCQDAGRAMIERRSGSIINVASMLGVVASAPIKQASYCATKGAVVNLSRELGCQWARKGVRVNALAPGYFPSEMTAEMVEGDVGQDFVARHCPMGRFGYDHELDGALLFLASDASTFYTAQVLTVDGGWTAR